MVSKFSVLYTILWETHCRMFLFVRDSYKSQVSLMLNFKRFGESQGKFLENHLSNEVMRIMESKSNSGFITVCKDKRIG